MGHIIAHIFLKKDYAVLMPSNENYTNFSTNFKEFNKYQVQIDIAFVGSK